MVGDCRPQGVNYRPRWGDQTATPPETAGAAAISGSRLELVEHDTGDRAQRGGAGDEVPVVLVHA